MSVKKINKLIFLVSLIFNCRVLAPGDSSEGVACVCGRTGM